MNTPNPLVPQGSLERQSKGKSTVRIAIFTIISIHAVFFAGLLMQGCRHDENKTPLKSAEATTNQSELPPLDSAYYASTQDVAQALAPVIHATTPAAPNITDVPASLPLPVASEPISDGKDYTIAKGDTLSRIAKANGVTLVAMAKANPNLDPSKLRPGQKIQIPPTAAPASGIGFAEPSKSDVSPAGGKVHTVKPGETLTRIAKQLGTSVKAIRAANNLKTDRLLVGQKLKVPVSRAANVGESKTSTVSRFSATSSSHASPMDTSLR